MLSLDGLAVSGLQPKEKKFDPVNWIITPSGGMLTKCLKYSLENCSEVHIHRLERAKFR